MKGVMLLPANTNKSTAVIIKTRTTGRSQYFLFEKMNLNRDPIVLNFSIKTPALIRFLQLFFPALCAGQIVGFFFCLETHIKQSFSEQNKNTSQY